DLIRGRRAATPAMLSGYSSQIEIAALAADADRMTRDYARSGTQDKRERVINAARMVRERLDRGDVTGARRLLDMDKMYVQLLEQNRWRTWSGSGEMEGAIDSELRGQNSSEQFNRALTYFQFSTEADRFRHSMDDWTRAMAP